MAKKKVFILGAGLAGLSAAWFMQKKGIACRVLEKEPEAGGLCRSKQINGFIFDIDGHLLHFKQQSVLGLIKRLMGNNLVKYERNAWIYIYDKYIPYPFQANLHNLPLPVIKDCILALTRIDKSQRLKNKKEQTFLGWINYTFGKGIAKHFMVPYNTKFWTVPPNQLNCDWVDGFVPVPTVSQIIKGAGDKSKRRFGYNAQFWYPKKGGINQVVLAFASRIKDIDTNCPITRIDIVKKEIKMASGHKEKFDYLISTIPLPEMPGLIEGLPKKNRIAFEKLRWNSIFNLNLGVKREDFSGRHWVYFPGKEFCFFRVGFAHNFSDFVAPAGKSSLYAEVSYSKGQPFDKKNIVRRIKKDLKKAGILVCEDEICAEDINDVKYGYPIYDKNYRESRKEAISFLLRHNILPCGRYGSWRYMSMEDAILDGKSVAAQLEMRAA